MLLLFMTENTSVFIENILSLLKPVFYLENEPRVTRGKGWEGIACLGLTSIYTGAYI